MHFMIGIGTLLNSGGIIAGGLLGHFAGRLFKEEQQDSLEKVCGISVLFIAVAGAMEGMLRIEGGSLAAGRSVLLVVCITFGTLLGEIIGIEHGFERFAEWLKIKSGNSKDKNFVNAFLTATFTVSIGAMAIVGSIEDGILGDYSTLAVKSLLDFLIIIVMTSSMGKGAAYSALPVFVLEGGMTLLARLIAPLMTDLAIEYMSMVGSVLIFCVGVNLVWGKKVSVANMLPSLLLAVAAAYLPWTF